MLRIDSFDELSEDEIHYSKCDENNIVSYGVYKQIYDKDEQEYENNTKEFLNDVVQLAYTNKEWITDDGSHFYSKRPRYIHALYMLFDLVVDHIRKDPSRERMSEMDRYCYWFDQEWINRSMTDEEREEIKRERRKERQEFKESLAK